jgi:hypothetical protein
MIGEELSAAQAVLCASPEPVLITESHARRPDLRFGHGPNAGAFGNALELLDTADGRATGRVHQRPGGPAARADRVRLGPRQRRTPLLLKTARRLEPLYRDLVLSRLVRIDVRRGYLAAPRIRPM